MSGGDVEAAERRKRSVWSTIVGVLFLLLVVPGAAPGIAEMYMASEHHHSVSHPAIVLESFVGTAWLVVSAVLFLRKGTLVRAMLLPGLAGLFVGLVGMVNDLGPVLTRPNRSDGREHALALALAMIPGVTGIGQVLEARKGPARGAYVATVVVVVLLASIVFGACKGQ